MPAPIAIAVHGASGRMGRSILELVDAADDVVVVAALVHGGSRCVDQPVAVASGNGAAPLLYTARWPRALAATVLVDFSVAGAFDAALALAVRSNAAFVSGTTGLDAGQMAALDRAAATIPVLWSANFSLGVALLSRLVREAASAFPDWDCEILETHHRRKRDAPSGTALALGEAVAAARGQAFAAVAKRSRDADDTARVAGEIGFASRRAGDIVGEHAVLFAADGECIELAHRATRRDVFARGALAASRWIVGQPPGRYQLAAVVARDDARAGLAPTTA